MSVNPSENNHLPVPPEAEENYHAYAEDVSGPVPPQEGEDLQEEDFQNMEEIERELAKTMGGGGEEEFDDEFDEEGANALAASKSISQSTDFLPSGAVPTINGRLSTHAAEFWFPGSRDCKCCKGFKYGCDCCTKNNFVACQEAGCVEGQDLGKKREEALQIKPPVSRGPSTSSTGGGSPHKSLPSPINASGVVYCKFELSPGGCRFGASCRFVHQNGVTGGSLSRTGSVESPKGGDGRQVCVYWMKGHCDFGDKCRFQHI